MTVHSICFYKRIEINEEITERAKNTDNNISYELKVKNYIFLSKNLLIFEIISFYSIMILGNNII